MSASSTRSEPWDAIVVGGGHNGLVTAAFLARAGLRTIVLEARDRVGGAAETTELTPGVRVPTLAHTVGRIRPSVVRDLGLRRHGLTLVAPAVRAFAPQPDGSAITLWGDARRTAAELQDRSPADAAAWLGFDARVTAFGRLLGRLGSMTPPDLGDPSALDLVGAIRTLRAYRNLGRQDARALLRILPTAVRDLADDVFQADALRALVVARGVMFTAMGPRSAGTSAVLLTDSAGNDGGAAGQTVYARGGSGAVAAALESAARAFGAEIRTGARVVRITSDDDVVTGVVLSSGEALRAPVVVSGVDPRQTLTRLVDPVAIGPTLRWRAGNIRSPGMTAKVNLALAGLPRFPAAGEEWDARLRGRIVLAPSVEALDRAFDAAKHGSLPEAPLLEATIPSLVDETLVNEPGGDPTRGPQAMSVIVHYVPYRLREGDWDGRRDELGDLVVRVLEGYAPGIGDLVTARQVITPLDLERDYGLPEGHPFHAEPGLDQWFAWRPLLGHARYRFGLRGLYLCGSGAHPGGGVTGGPGENAAREILADRGRGRGRRGSQP